MNKQRCFKLLLLALVLLLAVTFAVSIGTAVAGGVAQTYTPCWKCGA